MAIPDYQTCMLPLLIYANDQKEHSLREAVEKLATQFELTDDEIREMLPSGQQAVFLNRLGWARTYLKQAGLIAPTKKRGYFRITQTGLNVLDDKPDKITKKYLEQFEDFREFLHRKKKDSKIKNDNDIGTDKTPAEELETAYENLRENLANELIENFKNCPPSLFEKIIVELYLF